MDKSKVARFTASMVW